MSTPPPISCYGASDLVIIAHLKTMEAAGLAVGVVGLGLQLATTLQTYVEGVAGTEDRLRELSFDVASTASTLKQLEDMLDADKAAAENTSINQASDSVTIFTDQGRRDVYLLSRRCEKVYQGILAVIVSASSPPSAKVKAIAANVGLSDLTTTRLAQFVRALKWPLIESRVKTCLEELRWLKMDLLLHLQVATIARVQLRRSSKRVENSEDESTLEAVFERLMARRDTYRKAALEGRRQRKISAKAETTSEHLPVADSTLLHGNNYPSPSHFRKVLKLLDGYPEVIEDEDLDDDPFDVEAWTLPLPGRESQRLPFLRGDIIQRIKHATKHGQVSRLDQFLALTPEQRDQAQDLITQLVRDDARPRGYLALEIREDEIIVFVGVDDNPEVVYLDDPVGRTWQFSYKDFKSRQIAKEQICLLEVKDASLQQKIRDGQFDIRAKFNALIPPMQWHQFVKPGKTLEIAMWGDDPPSPPPALHRPSSSKAALKRLFTPRWRRALMTRVRRWRELRELREIEKCVDDIRHALGNAPRRSELPESEISEEESAKAEVDDEDLFDWSDDEVVEVLDSAETLNQLLASWTNIDTATS
ncbi:hypothetical protein CEP51_008463 [Fusarium floridanum]|uniref:Ubiquitin-like domain-containing protein n=1 Tax=Fusarium floridanum TaxID=1325733 RepID=A0A428RKT7_9HYPO|nr:hypothetical protein CEP51_008463 [Fusarium floridanum]